MEIWKRKSTCQSPIRLRQTLRLQFLRSSVKKMRQTGEWRHAQRASAPGKVQQPPLCTPSDGVGLPPLQEGQRDPGAARASFLVQLGNSVRRNPENLKLLQRATRTQREATTQSEHRLCRHHLSGTTFILSSCVCPCTRASVRFWYSVDQDSLPVIYKHHENGTMSFSFR